MTYAILRTAKLTTFGNIAGSCAHNWRTIETLNADPKRTHLNRSSGAQNAQEVLQKVKERLSTVKTVRKNAVLCIEYFIGASPEFFKTASPKEREQYFDDAEKWLKDRHGSENVVTVTRQYDETSPHIAAYCVPIDPKGKLNCSHFQDGREKLSAMQTDFAENVGKKYGLERGIEGSKSKHTSIKDYYAGVNAPTTLPTTQVPKVPEPTLIEKMAESMGISTDRKKAEEAAALAQKKRNEEAKATTKQLLAKSRQLDLLERGRKDNSEALAALRANSVQLRQIPLADVLERFGATIDPKDSKNWRADTGRITVTDTKFYNHDVNKGGGGAIDLVMHLNDCDYKTAVSALAREFGSNAVLSDVTVTQKQEIEAAALAPPPPFLPPVAAPDRWPRVRQYLTDVRKISAALVDTLHAKGKIYADKYANAVFVLKGTLGVELRGTGDTPYKGFKGKKMGFMLTKGGQDSGNVAFVESSIDAISLYESGKFQGLIIAVGGDNASFLRFKAEEYKAKGWKIYAAFDNDKHGEYMAAMLPGAIRLKPEGKDWNDDLVAAAAARDEAAAAAAAARQAFIERQQARIQQGIEANRAAGRTVAPQRTLDILDMMQQRIQDAREQREQEQAEQVQAAATKPPTL